MASRTATSATMRGASGVCACISRRSAATLSMAARGAMKTSTTATATVGVRAFSSSSHVLARRKQQTSGPGFMDEYKPVTGKMAADGLNRYDLDFLETVDWVNKLLLRLEEDGIKHVTKMATEAPAKPVELPQALVFTYTNRYTYDFTTKPPTEADVVVTLKVHVGSLGLTPEERHKFLLLTQNLYDPYQDVVTIKPQKNVDYSGDSHAKKRLRLIQVLDTFLNDAKSSTDKFTDVPLDLRRVKARRAHLAFPEQWKKPRQQAETETAQ